MRRAQSSTRSPSGVKLRNRDLADQHPHRALELLDPGGQRGAG